MGLIVGRGGLMTPNRAARAIDRSDVRFVDQAIR